MAIVIGNDTGNPAATCEVSTGMPLIDVDQA